jgi:two-component system phosphate regulon response regulator PhoB
VRKLLIADDEAGIRELVRMTLESDAYDIVEAANGEEAVELAREMHPELVLLDVMMPKVDGFEACRLLKDDPATSDIVVVMLTARAQESDRERGRGAGADEYFTKPFSPVALLRLVEEIYSTRLAS